MKIIPVLELRDVYYAWKFGWLKAMIEVGDTVLFRPEEELGKAFLRRLTIHEYMKRILRTDTYNLKFMLDHGIFVSNKQFRNFFHIEKTPENLVRVHSILGVDYAFAYDVPARFHLQSAIEMTIAKLNAGWYDEQVIKSIYPEMKYKVEKIANMLIPLVSGVEEVRKKVYRVLKDNSLKDEIESLSLFAIEESLKNLKRQLEAKSKLQSKYTLLPVVQGLSVEHAKMSMKESIDTLLSFGEKDLYLAIGTSGATLSDEGAKTINKLLLFGNDYAKKHGVSIKFHVLGVSSAPKVNLLRVDLIYSVDATTTRKRATQGKLFTLKDGKLQVVHISKIDKEKWDCKCPACISFKDYIFDPTGSRRNDVRLVHNMYIVKKYHEERRNVLISNVYKRANS